MKKKEEKNKKRCITSGASRDMLRIRAFWYIFTQISAQKKVSGASVCTPAKQQMLQLSEAKDAADIDKVRV